VVHQLDELQQKQLQAGRRAALLGGRRKSVFCTRAFSSGGFLQGGDLPVSRASPQGEQAVGDAAGPPKCENSSPRHIGPRPAIDRNADIPLDTIRGLRQKWV